MKSLSLIVLPVLLGLGILTWFQLNTTDDAEPPAITQSQPTPPTDDATAAPAQSTQADPLVERLADVKVTEDGGLESVFDAQSLQDTEVDGALLVGPDGHLIITDDLKSLFDYFLSTLGELELPQIIANLRNYFAENLSEPALGEANQVLNEYLNYKTALIQLEQAHESNGTLLAAQGDLDGLRARLNAIVDTRSSTLSPEVAEAFFAESEAYDRYTLERIRLQQDEQLSAEERAAQLALAQSQLPERLQQSLRNQLDLEQLRADEQRVREQGGSEAELYQVRAQTYGDDAARRLAEVDRAEADWNQRLSDYRAEKLRIEGSDLSDADKSAAIDSLRQNRFSGTEVLRVESLDRVGG